MSIEDALAAERTVIGGVLVHPRVLAEVRGEVDAADFVSPPHRAVFAVLVELDEARTPIDLVTVWTHIRQTDQAEKFNALGGEAYLAQLAAEVVTVENLEYHARQVARWAERRRWTAVLMEHAARARDNAVGLDDFFDQAEHDLMETLQTRSKRSRTVGAREGLKTLGHVLDARLEAARQSRGPLGVVTGYGDLDRATNGLRPGWLFVIAARPSVGKSALAANIVTTCAKAKIPSLIFSLEMENGEWWERMVSAEGSITADALQSGKMSQSDWASFFKVSTALADPELIQIDDTPGLKLSELRSRAIRWRAADGRGDHAVIVVDYLQLVHGTRKVEKRQEEVAEVSRGLKALAKELRVPIIALAQLNRESEKRANKRPTLADLRESGQIEQDADVVTFLYREEIAFPDNCPPDKRGTAELNIGKGRGIRMTTVHLGFHGEYTRFVNLSQRTNP